MSTFDFHVVSSVKGGCGKSTFALYLADYLASLKNTKDVYLIDLDTGGTSWYDDYREYLDRNETDGIFLNDIIDNVKIVKNRSPWWHFTNSDESEWMNSFEGINGKIQNVNLCIADPQKRKGTEDYQIDLFEQAVSSLIENEILNNDKYTWLVDKNRNKSGKNYGKVHIILDMPPGVESKAERVFRYWLPKKIGNSPKDNALRLYILSTLTTSSISANWEYVVSLFNPVSYKDWLIQVRRSENIAFSTISIILNDISDFRKYSSLDAEKTLKPCIQKNCQSKEYKQIANRKVNLFWAFIPHAQCVHSRYTFTTKYLGTHPVRSIDKLSDIPECECMEWNTSRKNPLSVLEIGRKHLKDVLEYITEH